jgi:hypothetical protein
LFGRVKADAEEMYTAPPVAQAQPVAERPVPRPLPPVEVVPVVASPPPPPPVAAAPHFPALLATQFRIVAAPVAAVPAVPTFKVDELSACLHHLKLTANGLRNAAKADPDVNDALVLIASESMLHACNAVCVQLTNS